VGTGAGGGVERPGREGGVGRWGGSGGGCGPRAGRRGATGSASRSGWLKHPPSPSRSIGLARRSGRTDSAGFPCCGYDSNDQEWGRGGLRPTGQLRLSPGVRRRSRRPPGPDKVRGPRPRKGGEGGGQRRAAPHPGGARPGIPVPTPLGSETARDEGTGIWNLPRRRGFRGVDPPFSQGLDTFQHMCGDTRIGLGPCDSKTAHRTPTTVAFRHKPGWVGENGDTKGSEINLCHFLRSFGSAEHH